MKKKVSTVIVACFVVVAILALINTNCVAAMKKSEYKWVASIVVPESVSYGKALRVFCDLVYARSDGRVKITPYFAGALGGERETFEAVKLGNVQISFQDIYGSFGGEKFDITNYPRLTSSHLEMAELTVPRDTIIHQAFSKWLLEDHNIKMLGMWAGGARDILNSKREIKRLSDLKGLKIRVPETPLWIDYFKRLGIVATPIPYPEVYTSMQTGIIDGHEGPAIGFSMLKTAELGKYIVRTQHVGQTFKMIMPNKLWESLPKDIQDILMRSAWDQAAFQTFQLEFEDFDVVKSLKEKYGTIFTDLPKEDEIKMDEIALKMLDDWRDKFGPEASEIIEKILKKRIEK